MEEAEVARRDVLVPMRHVASLMMVLLAMQLMSTTTMMVTMMVLTRMRRGRLPRAKQTKVRLPPARNKEPTLNQCSGGICKHERTFSPRLEFQNHTQPQKSQATHQENMD